MRQYHGVGKVSAIVLARPVGWRATEQDGHNVMKSEDALHITFSNALHHLDLFCQDCIRLCRLRAFPKHTSEPIVVGWIIGWMWRNRLRSLMANGIYSAVVT